MLKVLFICKQGEDYRLHAYGYFRKFSGLFNSARLVNEMLNENGVESAIETAIDNNCIDRLVTKHQPDICIIEAYWVVPEKFAILSALHPEVTWVIRIHSEVPFWATEGMSMDWTLRYLDYPNVILSPNARRLYKDTLALLRVKYTEDEIMDKVVYLPNYYPSKERHIPHLPKEHGVINVGCFGAIRPLKNQLIQAIASIDYANRHDLTLHFHINGNRIEGMGEPILQNIRQLFEHSSKHELIEHAWMPHSDFLNVVAQMDIGLQVSFTETFNIVTADMVTVGIPVVTSREISWVSKMFHADPNDAQDIVEVMGKSIFAGKLGVAYNRHLLHEFSEESKHKWLDYIEEQE